MKRSMLVTFCLLTMVMSLALTACGSKKAPEDLPAAGVSDNADTETEPEEITDHIITGGASLEEAEPLEFNTLYHGSYTEGDVWLSFTTGNMEEDPLKISKFLYRITLENLTVGSNNLFGYLVDASGNNIAASMLNNGYGHGGSPVIAGLDGTADTAVYDALEPNTTYYLKLKCDSKAVYSLRITDPVQDAFDTAEGRIILGKGEELTPASNQDDAPILAMNECYQSKYENGYHWIAFRTGNAAEDPLKITGAVSYMVTLDNHTVGSKNLVGYLVDEYGYNVKASRLNNGSGHNGSPVIAGQDGTADTAVYSDLAPNATYFLRVSGDSRAVYSIRITDPAQESFDTTRDKTVLGKSDAFIPASNQDDAPILSLNERYQGLYEEGYQWVAFHTGSVTEDPLKISEGIPYKVSLENQTMGSKNLVGYLVDEYGYSVTASTLHNGKGHNGSPVIAGQDGTADTAIYNDLAPDTTYYLRLQGESRASYILKIDVPESAQETGASDEETERFVTSNGTAVPGTSQSLSLYVPLNTTVTEKYEGGYSWLAFTTTEEEGAEYYVSLINCTVGSKNLYGYLVDEYGYSVKADILRNGSGHSGSPVIADYFGRADTAMYTNLKPNTTYYQRVQSDSNAVYAFRVSCPSVSNVGAYSTSSSLSGAVGALDENETFYTGTNQAASTLIKTNARYHGSYSENQSWVAFTTGSEEGAEYYVTLENLTPGSKELRGYLVDEYGYVVKAAVLKNGKGYSGSPVIAKQDGTADSAMYNDLKPNTTYYLGISGESKAEYILTIGAPEKEEAEKNTIEEAAVFEVPFELNESQVMFKANTAEFIYPEEVKAALQPVAEVILAHPEHPILLAGTTAAVGSQEKCMILSQGRAEAVKKMLVDEFGVPAGQLLTKGLGYEADPFERGKDHDSKGKFIETEGAKNRRVVVLDAETPVAKEILGNS